LEEYVLNVIVTTYCTRCIPHKNTNYFITLCVVQCKFSN